MRLFDLLETTRPYQEKIIDPALMTFGEYRDMVDPDHKMHPPSYDFDLEKLNKYQKPEDYQDVINTVKRRGIEFELRKLTTDRWQGKIVKFDENEEIVRDEKGMAVYLNQDEVKALIPESERFRYQYAFVDKDTQKIVGNTQDEWGALLIVVAQEYRGFGFGTDLVKLARDARPDLQSGGFTQSGLANLHRVWSKMVREYMESGFYSHLVRNGHITAEKAKSIMSSIGERTKQSQANYNTKNPKDWLLMTDGARFAMLYDKKIYDVDEPDADNMQMWVEIY